MGDSYGDQLLRLGRQRATGEDLLAECLKCLVQFRGKPLVRVRIRRPRMKDKSMSGMVPSSLVDLRHYRFARGHMGKHVFCLLLFLTTNEKMHTLYMFIEESSMKFAAFASLIILFGAGSAITSGYRCCYCRPPKCRVE